MSDMTIIGPADIYAELRNIQAVNDGKLEPELVVEFARDPGTALHRKFEWDDTVAAHYYRLDQARDTIQIFRYEKVTDGKPKRVRAFTSIKEGEHREYRDTVEVLEHPDWRAQHIAGLRREAMEWAKRASDFAEFADLVSIIERFDVEDLEA